MSHEIKILNDWQSRILHTVLPEYADRHYIRYSYSHNSGVTNCILFTFSDYRILWTVEREYLTAEVFMTDVPDDYFNSAFLMFQFSVTKDEFYEWFCIEHLTKLFWFIGGNIRFFKDNYLAILEYKEQHKDTLSYDMVKRVKDVENEGALMGML